MEQRIVQFRAAVILSCVAYLASSWFSWVPHNLYSDEMLSLAGETGTGGMLSWGIEAWWISQVVMVFLSLGVAALWRRALHLYTVWCLVLLFMMPLAGVSVWLPIEGYFGALSGLLSGVVLGMAYGTELYGRLR